MDGNRLERLTRPTAVVLWLVVAATVVVGRSGSPRFPYWAACSSIGFVACLATSLTRVVGVKEKIPDLSSPKWQAVNGDEAIKKVIANGSEKNPKMKAYKEIFSPTEIASLIPYIRNLKEK